MPEELVLGEMVGGYLADILRLCNFLAYDSPLVPTSVITFSNLKYRQGSELCQSPTLWRMWGKGFVSALRKTHLASFPGRQRNFV